MLPDRVSNPGPLTYESGALPIALRGPVLYVTGCQLAIYISWQIETKIHVMIQTILCQLLFSSFVSDVNSLSHPL